MEDLYSYIARLTTCDSYGIKKSSGFVRAGDPHTIPGCISRLFSVESKIRIPYITQTSYLGWFPASWKFSGSMMLGLQQYNFSFRMENFIFHILRRLSLRMTVSGIMKASGSIMLETLVLLQGCDSSFCSFLNGRFVFIYCLDFLLMPSSASWKFLAP